MEAEIVDFESLPESASFWTHMTAGAIAGMAEHSIFYPVDTIKTRMQVLPSPAASGFNPLAVKMHSLSRAMRSIVAEEGVYGLWRGVPSVLLGAGPAHALYFATYEQCKTWFGFKDSESNNFLATGAAGACATIIADALMNPFDVIKQKMQLGYVRTTGCAPTADTAACASVSGKDAIASACKTPSASTTTATATEAASIVRYQSVWHCTRYTLATEGWRALYVSYPTTLAMSVPFHAIHFSAYEHSKQLLVNVYHRLFSVDKKNILAIQQSPLLHCTAGAFAGGLAAFLTTPLDVTKTLLQTRTMSTCPDIRSCSSFYAAVQIIWRRQGLMGFWRGARARVVSNMPSTAICWGVYEYFKWYLGTEEQHHRSASLLNEKSK